LLTCSMGLFEGPHAILHSVRRNSRTTEYGFKAGIMPGSAHKWLGGVKMLFAIVAVLVVLWLLGVLAGIAGGFIHLVLLVAAALFLLQLVQGRRTI